MILYQPVASSRTNLSTVSLLMKCEDKVKKPMDRKPTRKGNMKNFR